MRSIILCSIMLFFTTLPFTVGVAIETLFHPRWSSDMHGLIFFLCLFLGIFVWAKVGNMLVTSKSED